MRGDGTTRGSNPRPLYTRAFSIPHLPARSPPRTPKSLSPDPLISKARLAVHGLTYCLFVCSIGRAELDDHAEAAAARRAQSRDRSLGPLALSGRGPRPEPRNGGSSRPEIGVAARGRWMPAARTSCGLRECSLAGLQAAYVAARSRAARAPLGSLKGRQRMCTCTVYVPWRACDSMGD